MTLIKRLKRNHCKECKFYVSKNNICQSKKCATNNPYISKLDKMFCKTYKEADNNTSIIGGKR